MTTKEKIESLVQQTAELPEEAQAEVVQSLVEMRSQHLGIYNLDDDEREALARSAEDERLGRFASNDEIDRMFGRYGALECCIRPRLSPRLTISSLTSRPTIPLRLPLLALRSKQLSHRSACSLVLARRPTHPASFSRSFTHTAISFSTGSAWTRS